MSIPVRVVVTVFVLVSSGASFAYDWTGKTGVVTLTESAEVTDADLEVVTNLTGIVLDSKDVVLDFKNTMPVVLPCYVNGNGLLRKSGTGDLFLGNPGAGFTVVNNRGTHCADYYTKAGVTIAKGAFYMPQEGTTRYWYGPLTLGEGTMVYTHTGAATGVDSLHGAGTITNTVVPKLSDYPLNSKMLIISEYGSYNKSDFSGVIGGNISIYCSGDVRLSGTDSTFLSSVEVGSAYPCNEKSACLRFKTIGHLGAPSSLGLGTQFSFGVRMGSDYGGKFYYEGEGDEICDKSFTWAMTYDYGAGYPRIDAGHKGGVTFTGNWGNQTIENMSGIVLSGSNTEDMVLSNAIKCWYGSDADKGFFQFRKEGTGSWRLADHDGRSEYFGAWFVQEGTLKYDSIADIGVNCSMGTATQCFPFQKAKAYAVARAEANRLPYEIELGSAGKTAVLEYSGANDCVSNDRRIGLAGSGATLSAGEDAGSVALYGGVKSVDGAAKKLTLAGTNMRPSTIGNLSNDVDAVLSVEKVGTGEWQLARDIRLTGDLSVKEGVLTIAPVHEPKNYKWYRLVITKLGKPHTNIVETGLEDMNDCKAADYYVNLRGLALYTSDGTPYTPTMTDYVPWDLMDEDQKKGSKSYKYPMGWWKGLQPGQVTVGDYKGSEYRTYPTKALSVLFANMQQDSASNHIGYNTYLGCTPSPTSPNNWLPIVFRLPDDAPAIAYYDLLANDDSNSTSGHISTWYIEGSEDGENWTKLHEISSCAHAKKKCWTSTGTNALEWVAKANCLSDERGYELSQTKDPEPAKYATDLSTVSSISVARGAVLQRLAGAYEVELPKLTVDFFGSGEAMVKGFKIAKQGVLNVLNEPSGNYMVPVSFIDCVDMANLESWTLKINGKARNRTLKVKDGKLYVERQGLIMTVF